jgi:CheY-like chemotaxis protein
MPAITDHETKRSTAARPLSSAVSTPLRKDDDSVHTAGGPKVDADSLRILVVDDDPNILRLVAKMVMRLGYHPTASEDAMDALSHLAATHFHLVLTDYKMPFMDGYQLADRVKAKYFGTRVIIMTGHCQEEVADMRDGSGVVDGLLLKPFNMQTLKAKIQTFDYQKADVIRHVDQSGG